MGTPPPRPFPEGHCVRLDAELLVSEQTAEPPETGLHLVEDQKKTLAVAPFPDALEIIVGGDVDAALALDRLQEHGGGALVGGFHNGLDVVVVHVDKPWSHGLERLLVVGVARGGKGRQSPAVERVVGGNDFVGSVTGLLPMLAGQLYGSFNRLSSTVAEEHLVQSAVFHQQLGKTQLWAECKIGLTSGAASTPAP